MEFTSKQKIKRILIDKIKLSELNKKKLLVKANNLLYVSDRIRHLFKRYNKAELFDYKKILQNNYFYCKEFYKGNFLYGIADSIRKYSNYNKPIKACIEHGVYFGKAQIKIESSKSGLPAIIVFSNERKQYLREVTLKPIIAIGPYIYYSRDYISEIEVKKYRKKFGKTLLVFPVHSADGIKTEYDLDYFINSIENIRIEHKYATVIVCLYYRDIELQRNKVYEDKGYIVCCSGRREDPEFLSRQKSFIKLASMTISNSVGTHIGYSILLGVPHYIINQPMEYRSESAIANLQIAENEKEAVENKRRVYEKFLTYSECITEEQYKICDEYWGLNNIKTKNEMYDLLKKCDEVYRTTNHKEDDYVKASKVIFRGNSEEMC